jgi:hypothetical protein
MIDRPRRTILAPTSTSRSRGVVSRRFLVSSGGPLPTPLQTRKVGRRNVRIGGAAPLDRTIDMGAEQTVIRQICKRPISILPGGTSTPFHGWGGPFSDDM